MEIFILIGLIFLNGLFAMSEMALVTARRSRLARLAEEGDKGAGKAILLGSDPTMFLSTIQIGITAIGVLSGIVGEAALSSQLSAWLQDMGLQGEAGSNMARFIIVVVITYVTIVIGELVPKRIAQFSAEGIARVVAPFMAGLSVLTRPLVFLLTVSTETILRIMGKKMSTAPSLTEEDIHAVLAEGSESGVIEKQEHEMLRNVFLLDDRQIVSLMTPRSDIEYIDVNRPIGENLELMMSSRHSRFPVCRGGLHEMLGVLTSKVMFRQLVKDGKLESLEENLLPGVYVPESMTGGTLLDQFRDSGVQMVFVIDEFGEIVGLVTLQDVLEALTGEFTPSNPEDVWVFTRDDGSLLLDGLIPLQELRDRLSIKSLPDEDRVRYHTLSGMLMCLLDRIPRTGDVLEWEDWRFEVVDMDGRRLDKVLASKISGSHQDTAASSVT
ncbi:MAG: HlyC/CorC family transporter [Prosthecochloris sp.]|nr:HlyC/CorC family transporter [Prosthecochloris sp.]